MITIQLRLAKGGGSDCGAVLNGQTPPTAVGRTARRTHGAFAIYASRVCALTNTSIAAEFDEVVCMCVVAHGRRSLPKPPSRRPHRVSILAR